MGIQGQNPQESTSPKMKLVTVSAAYFLLSSPSPLLYPLEVGETMAPLEIGLTDGEMVPLGETGLMVLGEIGPMVPGEIGLMVLGETGPTIGEMELMVLGETGQTLGEMELTVPGEIGPIIGEMELMELGEPGPIVLGDSENNLMKKLK